MRLKVIACDVLRREVHGAQHSIGSAPARPDVHRDCGEGIFLAEPANSRPPPLECREARS